MKSVSFLTQIFFTGFILNLKINIKYSKLSYKLLKVKEISYFKISLFFFTCWIIDSNSNIMKVFNFELNSSKLKCFVRHILLSQVFYLQ
jgi:hypothetical protein